MASALQTFLYLASAGLVIFAIYSIFIAPPSTVVPREPPPYKPTPAPDLTVAPPPPLKLESKLEQPKPKPKPTPAPSTVAPQPQPPQAKAQLQGPQFSDVACKELSGAPESRLWEDCLNSVGARSCLPLNDSAHQVYNDAVRFCAHNPGFGNLKPRAGPLDPAVNLVPRAAMDAPTVGIRQQREIEQARALAAQL